MNDLPVSILVLTYNPDPKKLLDTLKSILLQRGIDYEIVVADDGSKTPAFEEISNFFSEHSFERFTFVKNAVNKGTVSNILSGVKQCVGTYVKLISPGDMLYGQDTLKEWVAGINQCGADWSFSESISYFSDAGNFVAIKDQPHPEHVDCYLKNDDVQIRRNYLLHFDNVLGASVLVRKDALETYINKIVGKIILAEDVIYGMMIFDGRKVFYYPHPGILYEKGVGASAPSNSLCGRVQLDLHTAYMMIVDKCNEKDRFERDLARRIRLFYQESKLKKVLGYLTIRGFLWEKLWRKFHHRYTDVIELSEFQNQIEHV